MTSEAKFKPVIREDVDTAVANAHQLRGARTVCWMRKAVRAVGGLIRRYLQHLKGAT